MGQTGFTDRGTKGLVFARTSSFFVVLSVCLVPQLVRIGKKWLKSGRKCYEMGTGVTGIQVKCMLDSPCIPVVLKFRGCWFPNYYESKRQNLEKNGVCECCGCKKMSESVRVSEVERIGSSWGSNGMRKGVLVWVSLLVVLNVIVSAEGKSTHSVDVPDNPTLEELERGWNVAFLSWLRVSYGDSVGIVSTQTYSGELGQLYVVSWFRAGEISGSILGRAFDPVGGDELGEGEYRYTVSGGGVFGCVGTVAGMDCISHERYDSEDGSKDRWCECGNVEALRESGERGSCVLIPAGGFVGSYRLRPRSYGALPRLD